MANRFNTGPAPTQNNNNYMTDRSSTRCVKPPGGSSTMGSLIFGGGDNDSSSFMDDRKTRRYKSATPEHNPIVDKDSFYGTPTSGQRDRDHITAAPGAIARDSLVIAQNQAAVARRGSNNTSADYFAGGMGANEVDNNQRRTKRMYGPPGGASTFKLG